MKLLMCPECGHIFNLTFELRTCDCGQVSGKYVDYVNAEVNGKGISLAIGNGSLAAAISRMREMKEGGRNDFINKCRVDYCWVRPHEGPGNPHTRVNTKLKEEERSG